MLNNNNHNAEQDLDDLLDDALKEFDDDNNENYSSPKATKTTEKETTTTKQNNNYLEGSSSVAESTTNDDIDLDDILEKTLLSEEKQVVNHLAEQVTKFFSELEKEGNDEGENKATTSSSSSSTSSYNFQEVMKNTLDMLNKNAASMNNANLPTGEEGDQDETVDEGAFSGLLQKMMEVLMSPDILRQPMEELREKYPVWLKEKKGQVPEDEYQRVQRQYDLCCKICRVYETQQYPDAIDELIELMKAMQEQGQPPEEIVSQLSKPEGGNEEANEVHKLLQGLNLPSNMGDGKGCPTQ
ncbi:hypothetical protein C9374_005743 [Naegleria lovaniensis]|uniref:Peroxin-19 n=1 Tax=Naegleria lovaniensis TaxID=51637 RepID=A0AA88KMX8_NAELO|nr:Peroxin 19 (Pex19), putative [Naegleria lovaniensis]KAG2381951.1 hypothetical protein C9374_005743 [Naegleria lovaniensis]